MPNTCTNRSGTKLLLNAAMIAALSIWGSPAVAGDAEKAVAYAQCMRKSGFPDFPDPDAEGRILLRQRLDDRSAPAFRAAHAACNDLAPEGWTLIPRDGQSCSASHSACATRASPTFPIRAVPGSSTSQPSATVRN